MSLLHLTAALAAALGVAPATPAGNGAQAAGKPWVKHTINDRVPFEGAGAGDIDGDGKIDIFSGDSWYRAPDWKRHKVREVGQVHPNYHEDFADLPLDVNRDGKVDFVTCTYFTKRLGWIEHPGDAKGPWIEHDIDYPGAIEACELVDINGDGRPDLLPAINNKIVWYELSTGAPGVVWKRHDVSSKGTGHGIGYGDINSDGRLDLIGAKGWYEQPSKDGDGEWPFHAEFDLNGSSILILGRDVDGDGLTDLMTGVARGTGIYWWKQGRKADGKRTWTRHDLDPEMHQVHTLRLADLDGNGTPALVAGTRVYGHEGDSGAIDAPSIAAYRFDRAAGRWQKQIIYQGEPARNPPREAKDRNALKDFPRGTAGTGLYIEVRDLDQDGDLDLLCGGKSGLYFFENPRLTPKTEKR